MLTKEQASAAADQLIAGAELARSRKTLAHLALRAGSPPPGVPVARFRELVEEAEREVWSSWPLLCSLGAAILVLVALYYAHAIQALIGAGPALLLLLVSWSRRLVQSYVRRAVGTVH